jgi:hypothetical protein
MQMRWGRHRVKLAHWIVRPSYPIGRRIGSMARDGSVNIANPNPLRLERALAFR